MNTQIDPVCGMEVDEQSASGKSIFQGQEYYFCSTGCKQTFENNPQQYVDDSMNSGKDMKTESMSQRR